MVYCRIYLLSPTKATRKRKSVQLVLCLMDLTANKDADASNTDGEWTLQVDRGGLWYVKNTTHLFFYCN